MKDKSQLNRRHVLAAGATVAAAAAVPGVASAATDAAVATPAKPLAWHTATADDLSRLIGNRFRVSSQTAGDLVMELVAVEPVKSGTARPSDLPRAEGVVAVFDSPDKAPLEGMHHAVHRVSHAQLGAADLFFGASPKRRGGNVIEMVLN